MEGNLIERAADRESWLAFLNEKRRKQHLNRREEEEIQDFIDREGYLPLCRACYEGCFPNRLPVRYMINKEGSKKRRIVYTFPGDEGIFLKFIAHGLTGYEELLPDSCYAFRSSVGVRDAIRRIRKDSRVEDSWCLKVDISDYFNSIDVALLLPKLDFLRERDEEIHRLLVRLLTEQRVLEKGQEIRENHGVMAGTPTAPFLANLYLTEVDRFFEKRGVLYLRYSDDILLFADSREELAERQGQLYGQLSALGLSVNPDKVSIAEPGQSFDFLGIAYRQGEIDLSANTLRKTKAKIRRKSEALRRWQRRKGLFPDKAAIALARTMNRKFYGYGDPLMPEGE
ncbi:MAG: reverse transcriptase/maturase family protein, partial [Acetatifactor sp.]|nr:reverse transcriptase/maturase family protein [Acetatifactor sp.]